MENYSILTTLYKNDNPEFLRQSIDSMLAQTILTNDYVIVVDGPITKELEKVLDEYCKKYDFFHIVRLKENGGLGVALRVGIKECKNELIARLDADDLSVPERCELQLNEFEKDSKLAIVGSDMYEFDDDPRNLKDLKKMPATSKQIYEYGKRRNPFNHSSVMYKNSVIESMGNYSTMRRSQDVELWSKVIFSGYKCMNISKPLILFRTDGSNRVRRKKKWSNVKSDLKIFKRNYKMGYSSLFDYLYICIYQISFYLMPEKIANFLYMKLFRKSVNEEN